MSTDKSFPIRVNQCDPWLITIPYFFTTEMSPDSLM